MQIKNLHVARFRLNAGSILPLHDHPERTGLICVLKGKCQLKSYDIDHTDDDFYYLKQKTNKAMHESEISYLTESENNLHSILALEDSLIYDVFTPPYPDEDITTYFDILEFDEATNLHKARKMLDHEIIFPEEFNEFSNMKL